MFGVSQYIAVNLFRNQHHVMPTVVQRQEGAACKHGMYVEL